MSAIPGHAGMILGAAGSSSSSILGVLQALGLTSGLQLCLDAGDAGSYGGSGQTWADQSGTGANFYRGTNSSAESSDPTFNGDPGLGGLSNYWSFDGGDYFSLVAGSNPAWIESIHKAGAKFALAAWSYHTAAGAGLFSDLDASDTDAGFYWAWSSASPNALRFVVSNGPGGGDTFDQHTAATGSINAWHFSAIRMDVANSTVMLQIDGTQETYSAAYASPLASSASFTVKIGAEGDGSNQMANGSRIASMVGWNSTIPAASDLLALYNATKGGFGL